MDTIITHSVALVTRTSVKVFQGLHNTNNEHPQVHAMYSKLDLQAKLDTVQALMTEVSVKDFPSYVTDAVRACVNHVHQAVKLIDVDLQNIDKAIVEHRSMYLRQLRPANYSKELAELEEHVTLLDTRIDRLLQMMSLNKPLSASFVVI